VSIDTFFACSLVVSVALVATAFAAGGPRYVTVDASKQLADIRSLQGGHFDLGPVGQPLSNTYVALGIDMIRTHDAGVDRDKEITAAAGGKVVGELDTDRPVLLGDDQRAEVSNLTVLCSQCRSTASDHLTILHPAHKIAQVLRSFVILSFLPRVISGNIHKGDLRMLFGCFKGTILEVVRGGKDDLGTLEIALLRICSVKI
jgi:hypothetical protein